MNNRVVRALLSSSTVQIQEKEDPRALDFSAARSSFAENLRMGPAGDQSQDCGLNWELKFPDFFARMENGGFTRILGQTYVLLSHQFKLTRLSI